MDSPMLIINDEQEYPQSWTLVHHLQFDSDFDDPAVIGLIYEVQTTNEDGETRSRYFRHGGVQECPDGQSCHFFSDEIGAAELPQDARGRSPREVLAR
jgi:hypothetical protein